MRVPPALLQAFVIAARSGNLSRAAESLHVTVSALSHQMRQLEERLGTRVFVRGPRGVALSADGHRLFDAVAPPLDQLQHAIERFRLPREDVLTVSLLPSVATSWLVPRLPRFVARHPQLQLNLQSDVALVDFERDPVDAALRFGPGGWPGVDADFLFDEWITPVAAPALVERLAGADRADLSRWPLLGDPAQRWQQWFATFGGERPCRFVATLGDTESLQRAAVAGIGVALGRLTMARPLLEAGLLVRLTGDQLKADWSHWLVTPARSRGHAGLQAFRDWLLAEAEADRHSLSPAAAQPS